MQLNRCAERHGDLATRSHCRSSTRGFARENHPPDDVQLVRCSWPLFCCFARIRQKLSHDPLRRRAACRTASSFCPLPCRLLDSNHNQVECNSLSCHCLVVTRRWCSVSRPSRPASPVSTRLVIDDAFSAGTARLDMHPSGYCELLLVHCGSNNSQLGHRRADCARPPP